MIDTEMIFAMVFGLGATSVVVVIFLILFVTLRKEKRKNVGSAKTNVVRPATTDSAPTPQQKHALHVADAHEHAHLGEEEHYEEIVGSLGDVNDEGCADLDGVRFIAHDIAYETQKYADSPEYGKVARVMILGEILNSPRFKNPYRKPRN